MYAQAATRAVAIRAYRQTLELVPPPKPPVTPPPADRYPPWLIPVAVCLTFWRGAPESFRSAAGTVLAADVVSTGGCHGFTIE